MRTRRTPDSLFKPFVRRLPLVLALSGRPLFLSLSGRRGPNCTARRGLVASQEPLSNRTDREMKDQPARTFVAGTLAKQRAWRCGSCTERRPVLWPYRAPTGSFSMLSPRIFVIRTGSSTEYLGPLTFIWAWSSIRIIPATRIIYPAEIACIRSFTRAKELEHEKEVRAFSYFRKALTIDTTGRERLLDRIPMPPGLATEVNIEKLVETIRIQPATLPWARESIENFIRKYGRDMKLIPSDIDEAPLYG